MEDTTSISVNISNFTFGKLRDFCRRNDKDINAVITRAISEYLNNQLPERE